MSLREYAESSQNYLQKVFGFEKHRYKILRSDTRRGRNVISRISDSLGIQKPEFSGERKAYCCYVGDLGFEDVDYIIFSNSYDKIAEASMAEEVTHGEHDAVHVPNKRELYSDRFSVSYIEMVGYLGFCSFLEARKEKELIPNISKSSLNMKKVLSNGYSVPHFIGMVVGEQLLETGDVPFEEIFWAKDQSTGWGIVNEILTPKIPVSDDKMELRSCVENYLEKIGLEGY